MAVFGGLTNSCEKKRSKKQRSYIQRMLNILGMHAQIHKVKKKIKKIWLWLNSRI